MLRTRCVFSLGIVLLLGVMAFPARAVTFYVDPAGDDSRAGTSTSTAWQTLSKIEDYGKRTGFLPGDAILLKRGGVWRERLNFPSSGTAAKPIIIDAYGSGNKPLILASRTGLSWTRYSGNIWATGNIDLAPNTNVGFILLTQEVENPVLGVNVARIVSSVGELKNEGDFVWVASPQLGETYGRLGMYTASAGGPAAKWPLMEVGFLDRGLVISGRSYVTVKNIDARYGTGGSFRICDGSHHIILDGCEASYGGGTLTDILGIRAGDLIKIDTSSHDVTIRNCRASNAYETGISVEAWYSNDVLYNITIENNVVDRCSLGIGANTPFYDGVVNTEVHNIYVRGNTLTNIGYGWTPPAMCSHGIGIWGYQNENAPGSLHDYYIEDNNIDRFTWNGIRLFDGSYFVSGNKITGGTGLYQEDTWDRAAGIVVHGSSPDDSVGETTGTVAYNVVYGNACSGVLFINNTPPAGSAVGFYNNTIYNNGTDSFANVIVCGSNGITSRNNIFGGANSIALSVETTTNMTSDNNCFFRASGTMLRWRGQDFTRDQFANYRSTTGWDARSWVADPLFVSAADFHLMPLSPCVDGGMSAGFTADFDGVALPQLASVDIGAFELPRPASLGSPTVTLTSTAPSLTNAPVPVVVSFDAPVIGFTASDLVAQNGTVTNFFGAGANYTFTLSPTAQGSIGTYVPASVAVDGGNRGNLASYALMRTYDSVAPTVTMTSTVTSPTKTNPIPVTITFSESVTGFTVSDLQIYNSTVIGFTGSGAKYTVTLRPIQYKTAGIRISAGVATDAAGNGNLVATPWSCYYYGS